MSTLRLYSYWRSSASHRVRIALQLKSLAYEYVPVNLGPEEREQFSAAYRALNPQSRVPALETADGLLTQSMAILEWLEETYPEPALLPGTARDRARARAMAQILVADVQPLQNQSVTRYLQATVHLDEQGLKRWLHTWIARGLGAMEDMLRQDQRAGGFCLGERPTLADVCLVAQCASARRFGVELTEYPAVAAVDQHCNALPAFQRAAPARQPDAPP